MFPSTNSSRSIFENLANEIIFEIFDHLDVYHIYNAFNSLNSRFVSLLHNSNIPLYVNMSFVSKSKFQRYLTQMILPNSHRIFSLHLGNRLMFDEIFSSSKNIQKFIGLRTLILDNILALNDLNCLTSFSNLSSLIIHICDSTSITNAMWQSIFCLPALKYFKISTIGVIQFPSSSYSICQQSTIEHLVINSQCDFYQLSYLFSYLPYLRRLSINYLFNSSSFMMHPWMLIDQNSPKISLKAQQLTHISLKLQYVPFHRFEQFFICFSPNIQVLRLSIDDGRNYLDANQWEKLITTFQPNLRIFDFQHTYTKPHNLQKSTYEKRIKQFTSQFWLDRKWYFGYQYGISSRNSFICTFYSVEPYRRRSHVLYGQHHQNRLLSSDYNLVDHVEINNSSAMSDCSIFFENAQQLTLSKNISIENSHLLTCALGGIVPLKQLRMINLYSDSLHVDVLIHLLTVTPNCSQLTLTGEIIGEMTLSSATGNVKKMSRLIVKSMCTLTHVKFLTELCSQIEHLSISVRKEELNEVMKYLFSECNQYTRHLTSIHIRSTEDIYVEKVENLLLTLRQSDNFSIEDAGYIVCHIWC